MLTKGDEYPIHQTAEPIAFSGTDRNFYDRYFFCGYRPDGGGYFGVGFGVYPHLNVADAHFSVLRDGVQHSVHASRLLNMERMDLQVGPIRIEVIEPLQKLRLLIDSPEGIKADLVMEGRSFPVQEPRFTRRIGPRTMMDLTRFTQNVRWSGWVEVDGKRETYEGGLGTRDRSWGVRPIGAPDQQPQQPAAPQQFYWLWAPTNFPNLSLYYHVNDDADGVPWNTRATLAMDGANTTEHFHLHDTAMKVDWKKGQRWAQGATLSAKDASGRDHTVTWTPRATFMMKGIGYGHPDWGHGHWKGESVSAREDFRPDALDPLLPMNLHIQAICTTKHKGAGTGSEGVGILEQLVIGPHAPSGFKSLLDGAA
ncbi:MAG: hypothetical protein JNM47_15180 [Hyphomonadaceae bacterium]|nr:hypothetical protein [Hyphomonadaceae bacterium]